MNRIFSALMKTLLAPFFRSIVTMPGRSHEGALPELKESDRLLAQQLRRHVIELTEVIPDRSLQCPAGLEACASYISAEFSRLGYLPKRQNFQLGEQTLCNIEAELPGTKNKDLILVLGAHYDTVPGTPGADDNASGIAVLLELARYFANNPLPVTLRFVAFSNEETYNYETMGSYVYAQRCRQNEDKLLGMFSLEMLGSFSDEEGSQNYPFPFSLFYPTRGNFAAFIGNTASRDFLARSIKAFRQEASFPSQGCAAPSWVSDASRSDHLSFWKFNYPAVMITDTSNFRYKHYHGAEDTVDKLCFDRMSLVTTGIARMLQVLAKI